MIHKQKKILQALEKDAVPLDKLKANLLQGVVNNPPVAQTMSKIGTTQTLDVKENETRRKYSLHFMVILETLTTLMLNDKDFANKLMDKILIDRGIENPGSSYENFRATWAQTNDLFAAIKQISVDPGIWHLY